VVIRIFIASVLLAGCFPFAAALDNCKDAGLCIKDDAGLGVVLSIVPNPWSFGSIPFEATNAQKRFIIANDGALTSGPLAVRLTNTGTFALANDGCSTRTLAVGERCEVDVIVRPTSQGAQTASLFVGDARADLDVTVLPPTAGSSLTPSSWDAGSVPTRLAVDQVFRFRNTGASSLERLVTQTAGRGFRLVGDQCSGLTLPPNGECQLTVRFEAMVNEVGPSTGQLSVTPLNQASALATLSAVTQFYPRIQIAATGSGQVVARSSAFDGGQLACSSNCIADVPEGTRIRFQVNPARGWGIRQVDAPCARSAECEVAVTADTSLTWRFELANRVFLSMPTVTLDGGVNSLCETEALAAGLGPGFSALHSSNGSLVGQLMQARGFVRLDGVLLADLPRDFLTSTVLPNLTENGTFVYTRGILGRDEPLMHGFTSSGGAGQTGCLAGTFFSAAPTWLTQTTESCPQVFSSSTVRLLCIEKRVDVVVPLQLAPGTKRAFVTTASVSGGTPPAAADALCDSEAQLSGGYRAIRFPDNTPQVLSTLVRPDGARLSPDGGPFVDFFVTDGGQQPSIWWGDAGITCANWSDGGASLTGTRYDLTGLARADQQYRVQTSCATQLRLLCAER
jgi:hypothetical protein